WGRARRGHRRLGTEGPLRQRPSDIDDPVPREPRTVERPHPARVQQGWVAARAEPHRGHHATGDRAWRTDERACRTRRRDRDPRMAGQSGGPEGPGLAGLVDPWYRVGAVPAANVR